jgi:WD40 repeat protein
MSSRSRLRRVLLALVAPALALGCDAPPARDPGLLGHVDAAGDLLPLGACARLGTERFRTTRPIQALAFSPDSQSLAIAGEDCVLVSRVPGGAETARLHGHTEATVAVAFSPDGKTLVSSSRDGSVRAWEVASGVELRRVAVLASALAYSPDGGTLALATADGCVRILDAGSFVERRTLRAPRSGGLYAVAFTPDGTKVVASGSAAPLLLFDVETGEELAGDQVPADGSGALAVSPSGRDVAYVESDRILIARVPLGRRLEDLAGRVGTRRDRVLATFRSGDDAPGALAFSPDGRFLLLGRTSLEIRDALTGARLLEMGGFSPESKHLVYSPDGEILAVASGREVELLRARTLEPLLDRHRLRVTDLAFAPDGGCAATSSLDGTVRLWDSTSGRAIARFAAGEPLESVAFAPDGRTLYAGDRRGQIHVIEFVTTARLRLAWLHGAKSSAGFLSRTFEDRSGGTSIAVSADGRTLASVGRGELSVFSTRTGLVDRSWLLDGDRVAFLPDGKTLAVGVVRDLKLLSLGTGDGTWPLAPDERGAFALSRDGRTLAIVSEETRIVVRDLASGSGRVVLAGEHAARIRSVAFAPSGRTLASAGEDGSVVLWDAVSGRAIRHLAAADASRDRMRIHVAFTPDGSKLAVFGEENTVLLFDTTDGG